MARQSNIGTEIPLGNLTQEDLADGEQMLRRLANRHRCAGTDCRDILGHADDMLELSLALEACGLLAYKRGERRHGKRTRV